MVVAQFTGCSLQNDYTMWQKYVGGTDWVPVTGGSDYVSVSPNDLGWTVSAKVVSYPCCKQCSFATGQRVRYWSRRSSVGSNQALRSTITNSNSNFGGVAALADGI